AHRDFISHASRDSFRPRRVGSAAQEIMDERRKLLVVDIDPADRVAALILKRGESAPFVNNERVGASKGDRCGNQSDNKKTDAHHDSAPDDMRALDEAGAKKFQFAVIFYYSTFSGGGGANSSTSPSSLASSRSIRNVTRRISSSPMRLRSTWRARRMPVR